MRRTASERAALRWARWLARTIEEPLTVLGVGDSLTVLGAGDCGAAGIAVMTEARTAAAGYGERASAVILEIGSVDFLEGPGTVTLDGWRLQAPANAMPRGSESAEPFNGFVMVFRGE